MIEMSNIEITTLISVSLLILFGILTYTKKISVGIAILSVLGGTVIAWAFAPYNQIIIQSFSNSVWYGYDWSILSILGLAHFVSMLLMVMIAGYNLHISGGKILWA